MGILQNPVFCLRKLEHLSMENRKDWIKSIQSVKNPDKGIAIISYLKWNLKKEIVDPPCHSSPKVQNKFKKKIRKSCKKKESSDENTEIVKILAPLTDNPNAPDIDGETPIHWAAENGHTEIVKILAPLTDNPNARDDCGTTPIHFAACNGHTEIVKILASLTNNPNDPDIFGWTPIYCAAELGHREIVKILAPLTDNPNAPSNDGQTPIHMAAKNGHTEVVKILAPL